MEKVQDESQVESTLADGDKLKITIVKKHSGEMSIQVETDEEGSSSYYEVVGLIEVAKSDLIRQQNQESEADRLSQTVEVAITEDDFKLDKTGRLERSGKKVGDIIEMPLGVAQLRGQAIQQMKLQEEAEAE